jgi:hypothetical protein
VQSKIGGPGSLRNQTGLQDDRNLRAFQLLLGQTIMDSTVRYLDVGIDDAQTVSEGIDLYIGCAAADFQTGRP